MTRSDRPLFTAQTGQRDAAWVEAVRAGQTETFSQLVEAYQRVAVATAYRLLGNRDDAAEVAQDAFFKAFQALDRLNDPTRFGPWLLRTVTNLSLNARRSRKSRSTVSLEGAGARGADDDTSNRPIEPATSLGPVRRAQGHELRSAIEAALETLPDKQRLALVLFTIEGWPQKEIAELLDCSLETVKWNVFKARQRLREMLDGVMPD